MSKLSDLMSQSVRTLMGGARNYNAASTLPVLAINGAAAATVKTTNAISSIFDGVPKSKAALAAQALTANAAQQAKITNQVGFYTLPAGKTCYLALAVDTAGNVYCIQGTYAGQALTFQGNPQTGTGAFPDVGESLALFGGIKVASTSAAFTPATTALDAANITFTFQDLILPPSADAPF